MEYRSKIGTVLQAPRSKFSAMLLLSYGMTKSGSTLAFELSKAILESRGYVQRRLPDSVVTAGHHINFWDEISNARLRTAMTELAPSEIIAIKLHAPIGAAEIEFVENAIVNDEIRVHVNFRDPREVCLSLLDAGEQARAKERQAFAEIECLEDAVKVVNKQMGTCRQWGSIAGALHLFYNDVAFASEPTAQRICADLGFSNLDKNEMEVVASRLLNDAFTQRNKAVKDRYKDDLSVRQNEYLLEELKGARSFIRRVCEQRDYSWFSRRSQENLEDVG